MLTSSLPPRPRHLYRILEDLFTKDRDFRATASHLTTRVHTPAFLIINHQRDIFVFLFANSIVSLASFFLVRFVSEFYISFSFFFILILYNIIMYYVHALHRHVIYTFVVREFRHLQIPVINE